MSLHPGLMFIIFLPSLDSMTRNIKIKANEWFESAVVTRLKRRWIG